ncbi:hypothetical protein H072_10568 [Dactylellina haptotyla CBS 200.50]|uniref:Uncharacterized protein n=1 Tax=Dactylellina haptotyla (strain CBS 200.50) TaxID=1284197 RepID=S8BA51_DACHA|nr:hypothetical protein H072_10568 [Dactylellina haptotyla CBS 200.50]
MANPFDHHLGSVPVADRPTNPNRGLLACSDNVILAVMENLRIEDLVAFASTNKSIHHIYRAHAQQVMSFSLRQTLRKPDFCNWFPFPVVPDQAQDAVEEPANAGVKYNAALSAKEDKQAQFAQAESHIGLLRHANRVINVFSAVKFFAVWFHRMERHDGNGNHNCFTEQWSNRTCNETLRVLVFLAQNQVYQAHRYARHCLFDERILTQCGMEVFDKIELPLPENWWIRASFTEENESLFGDSNKDGRHDAMREFHRECAFIAHRDECFQKRRMAVAKLLAKGIDITPARRITEYECQGQRFWYDRGIVTGLVFTQIAPLTWCHDSMISFTMNPEDILLTDLAYLGPAALEYFAIAGKVVDTLKIRF